MVGIITEPISTNRALDAMGLDAYPPDMLNLPPWMYEIKHYAPGWWILLGALLLAHLSGYTNLVAHRGCVLLRQSLARSILGGLAFPSWLGLYLWGGIYRPWWFVPSAFLGFGLVITPILYGLGWGNRGNLFAFHYWVQPVYDLAVLAGCGVLWWAVLA